MSFRGRVLVVDDHHGWRNGVCSVLRTLRWQVVGEAESGSEAIGKAEALRPDLILLDIELQRMKMTGLEAATRIVASDPGSRILFVTGHRSWDIVEAAFGTGGRGYLVKGDVGHELQTAMDAVLDGKRFVSRTLTGRPFNGGQQSTPPSHRHEVGFYSDDSLVVEDFVRFGKAALDAGKTFILVAFEPTRKQVQHTLAVLGVDVERAIAERRYQALDVADVLSSFMVNGWPDEERFWKAGTSLFTRAAAAARCNPPGVAACGEAAPSLLRDGRAEAAIRLERLWDELARTFNVDVLCPYPMGGFQHDETSDVLHRICREHSAQYSR
jgi:DNA-binding NarL/FixJ family response regulator